VYKDTGSDTPVGRVDILCADQLRWRGDGYEKIKCMTRASITKPLLFISLSNKIDHCFTLQNPGH
jgi:hypothetical protein